MYIEREGGRQMGGERPTLVGRADVSDAGVAHGVGFMIMAQERVHAAEDRRLQPFPCLEGLIHKGAELQTCVEHGAKGWGAFFPSMDMEYYIGTYLWGW